jgi:glycosyltransferase involved in cell wall biosynthesis
MSDGKPTVFWVFEEKLSSWAYGINSRRIASRIKTFEHFFAASGVSSCDLKISFDILTHINSSHIKSRANIVRIGGLNPLTKVAGGNRGLRQAFSDVAVVIALSPEIKRIALEFNPNVEFILNGLDLTIWHSRALLRDLHRPFRAGLAAALKTTAQREVKGYELACDACKLAGVELVVAGRGVNQIPHEQMIEDFYSKIDVLVHPVGPGKEASSNVIMESLALGIPVVTTRDAGYHGLMLAHGVNALIVPREVECFAEALISLRDDAELRNRLRTAGRAFAETHHDLDSVGREYDKVFRSALAMTEGVG